MGDEVSSQNLFGQHLSGATSVVQREWLPMSPFIIQFLMSSLSTGLSVSLRMVWVCACFADA